MSLSIAEFLFICFFNSIASLKDCGRPFTVDIKVASSKKTKWSGFSYICLARAESKLSFLFSNLRDLSVEILC